MSDWVSEHEDEQWGSYGKAEPEPIKEPTAEELAKLESDRALYAESDRKHKEAIDLLEKALTRKWASEGLTLITENEERELDNGIVVRYHHMLVKDGRVIAALEIGDWEYMHFSGDKAYQYDLETWDCCDPRDIEKYTEWL